MPIFEKEDIAIKNGHFWIILKICKLYLNWTHVSTWGVRTIVSTTPSHLQTPVCTSPFLISKCTQPLLHGTVRGFSMSIFYYLRKWHLDWGHHVFLTPGAFRLFTRPVSKLNSERMSTCFSVTHQTDSSKLQTFKNIWIFGISKKKKTSMIFTSHLSQ